MKCVLLNRAAVSRLSLPVRGAWIEIDMLTEYSSLYQVAPRAGSVD